MDQIPTRQQSHHDRQLLSADKRESLLSTVPYDKRTMRAQDRETDACARLSFNGSNRFDCLLNG